MTLTLSGNIAHGFCRMSVALGLSDESLRLDQGHGFGNPSVHHPPGGVHAVDALTFPCFTGWLPPKVPAFVLVISKYLGRHFGMYTCSVLP